MLQLHGLADIWILETFHYVIIWKKWRAMKIIIGNNTNLQYTYTESHKHVTQQVYNPQPFNRYFPGLTQAKI